MPIKITPDNLHRQITDPQIFATRRKIIQAAAALTALPLAKPLLATGKYANVPIGEYSKPLQPTAAVDVQNYTNYYEFTGNKTDSTVLAQRLSTRPWQVTVSGEADKTGTFDLDDLLNAQPLEQRIYRFRCVEAWSMVVPWLGFPLPRFLKTFQPNSRAKYVSFTTLYNPQIMIGQKRNTLVWPYQEGLRIDEAMHPLSFVATGMYDNQLPKQNGAPLRLVLPWKYGFKSIKAIVAIKFTEAMPATAWNLAAPNEYGFYANVNPEVAHPRWSQKSERILGASIFTPKRRSEKFNGYGEQVAGLYSGMDLTKYY